MINSLVRYVVPTNNIECAFIMQSDSQGMCLRCEDSGDEKFTSRSYEITYNWYVIDKYPYFGFNVSNTSPVFIRHPILPPDTIMMPRKKMLLRSLDSMTLRPHPGRIS